MNAPEDWPECGCGHSADHHPAAGPCNGTGAELDPIYGADLDEPCACTSYGPPPEAKR